MTVKRYYSSTAVDTTLAVGCSSSDTTITVSSTVGFPSSFPYTLALGYDTSSEELVNIVGAAGSVLSIGVVVGTASVSGRGTDSTTAQIHSAGSSVKHVISGRDLRETQVHYDADSYYSVTNGSVTDTFNLHGLGSGDGSVVGTLKVQALTNKTISGANNTIANIANASLTNSSVTVNGSSVALGGSVTVTATPTAGTVVDASIVAGGLSPSKITGTAVITTDSRLSDTRVPTDASVTDAKIASTLSASKITGVAVTKTDTGTVTSTMILDGTILDADINASAAIADTKLATIATVGKVSNSATTATNTNTASAIVARDGSGNFVAGTITASLTGNVTGNVSGTSGSTTGNAATVTNGVYTTTTSLPNVTTVNSTTIPASSTLLTNPGAWTGITPTISGGTTAVWTLNNGTIVASWIQLGKTIHFKGSFKIGSATVVGDASLTISLPTASVAADSNSILSLNGSGRCTLTGLGANGTIIMIQNSTTTFQPQILLSGASGASTSRAGISTGNYTRNSGDLIIFAGTYEAA